MRQALRVRPRARRQQRDRRAGAVATLFRATARPGEILESIELRGRWIDASRAGVEGCGAMQMSPAETRVLGCLMEKERTTPETYPLTLNSLLSACNQTTNRDPILTLGEREIEEALDELRQKKLATVVFGAGSRVQKYRHTLADVYNFSPQEYALLCVLLLRGPQTAGELRGRAERMAPFTTLAEVESVSNGLAEAGEPLVRLLPARPGQKERRYVQLLSGEPVEVSPDGLPETPVRVETPSRIDALAQEVGELRAQVTGLRESVEELRRQLGG